MKTLITLFATLLTFSAFAQEATVDVTLSPAGSFKAKTSEVKGMAIQKGDFVEAQNIAVKLTGLKTGISLRDQHTKKYLETDKHPEAILVSAKGKDGKGEGVIKIKGIERKIAGTYKIVGDKLQASFPVKFSEFNITGVKYMGVGVQDEGVINVSVPFKK